MTIDSLISQEDIGTINKARSSSQTTPVELHSLLTTAEAQLAEMGIYSAAVDLIRTQKGHILWGSGRVPLVIQTGHQKFVLKPYDQYNPKTEKRVLKVVQGKLAPAVLYFGNDFYAEQLVNLHEARKLEAIADEGNLAYAVERGAKIHAELAKMRINYNHQHWMDEFHLTKDGVRITDFGTSIFFRRKERGSREFRERVDYVKQNGAEAYICDWGPVPCFDPTRPRYEETKAQIAMLDSNPTRTVDLLYVLKTGIIGVKQYIELKGFRRGIIPNAWDEAMELFPLFVVSFANVYTSNQKSPSKI